MNYASSSARVLGGRTCLKMVQYIYVCVCVCYITCHGSVYWDDCVYITYCGLIYLSNCVLDINLLLNVDCLKFEL
jgi:hypothetical protein